MDGWDFQSQLLKTTIFSREIKKYRPFGQTEVIKITRKKFITRSENFRELTFSLTKKLLLD